MVRGYAFLKCLIETENIHPSLSLSTLGKPGSNTAMLVCRAKLADPAVYLAFWVRGRYGGVVARLAASLAQRPCPPIAKANQSIQNPGRYSFGCEHCLG